MTNDQSITEIYAKIEQLYQEYANDNKFIKILDEYFNDNRYYEILSCVIMHSDKFLIRKLLEKKYYYVNDSLQMKIYYNERCLDHIIQLPNDKYVLQSLGAYLCECIPSPKILREIAQRFCNKPEFVFSELGKAYNKYFEINEMTKRMMESRVTEVFAYFMDDDLPIKPNDNTELKNFIKKVHMQEYVCMITGTNEHCYKCVYDNIKKRYKCACLISPSWKKFTDVLFKNDAKQSENNTNDDNTNDNDEYTFNKPAFKKNVMANPKVLDEIVDNPTLTKNPHFIRLFFEYCDVFYEIYKENNTNHIHKESIMSFIMDYLTVIHDFYNDKMTSDDFKSNEINKFCNKVLARISRLYYTNFICTILNNSTPSLKMIEYYIYETIKIANNDIAKHIYSEDYPLNVLVTLLSTYIIRTDDDFHICFDKCFNKCTGIISKSNINLIKSRMADILLGKIVNTSNKKFISTYPIDICSSLHVVRFFAKNPELCTKMIIANQKSHNKIQQIFIDNAMKLTPEFTLLCIYYFIWINDDNNKKNKYNYIYNVIKEFAKRCFKTIDKQNIDIPKGALQHIPKACQTYELCMYHIKKYPEDIQDIKSYFMQSKIRLIKYIL